MREQIHPRELRLNKVRVGGRGESTYLQQVLLKPWRRERGSNKVWSSVQKCNIYKLRADFWLYMVVRHPAVSSPQCDHQRDWSQLGRGDVGDLGGGSRHRIRHHPAGTFFRRLKCSSSFKAALNPANVPQKRWRSSTHDQEMLTEQWAEFSGSSSV